LGLLYHLLLLVVVLVLVEFRFLLRRLFRRCLQREAEWAGGGWTKWRQRNSARPEEGGFLLWVLPHSALLAHSPFVWEEDEEGVFLSCSGE
jgi:hypothetical protein